ncbi:hypothetical protein P3339_08045 [Microbulbifer sp. MLAF003]|uniref:hypothetical protein n=1 Tax=Microbulbifer sp. MLAF003 TaxID=3032582 RepID=UPI0024ADA527|nr:hypothetical protein [Microbulbifer sp. MLAF003]WHI52699.1 hypothetical protein P3339_08045 [Microbulbifer sp. MLAF003]
MMLDDNSKDDIVFKYLVNDLPKTGVRSRVRQGVMDLPKNYKPYWGADWGVLDVQTTFLFNCDDNVSKKVIDNDTVLDVRFWLLRVATSLQLLILKIKGVTGGVLKIHSHREAKNGDFKILVSSKGFKINWMVKFIVRVGFLHGRKVDLKNVSLSAVFRSLAGSANDALRDNDRNLFSGAVNKLTEWHSEISHMLLFKNDGGFLDSRIDSWDLESGDKSYLDEFLGLYLQLGRDAIEKIPINSYFLKDVNYMHVNVYKHGGKSVDYEIERLMSGSHDIWRLLVDWYSYALESSNSRVIDKYHRLVDNYFEAWEHWLWYVVRELERSDNEKRIYRIANTHLKHSASTIITALNFNDFQAANWCVEMLNGWLDQLWVGEQYYEADYLWNRCLIDPSLLQEESNNAAWIATLNGREFNGVGARNIAFKNAHLDMRILTACYILKIPRDDQSDKLVRCVRKLLSAENPQSSGFLINPYVALTPGDVLGAFIRHKDFWGNGYNSWLSSVLSLYDKCIRDERTVNRMPLVERDSSFNDMRSAYVEICMSMSDTVWHLPDEWDRVIFSDFFTLQYRDDVVSELKKWIEEVDEGCTYKLLASECIDEYRGNFITSLEGIIDKIENSREQFLRVENVDLRILRQLGEVGSEIFCSSRGLKYPLFLFEHINLEGSLEDRFTFDNECPYPREWLVLGSQKLNGTNALQRSKKNVMHSVGGNILRAFLNVVPLEGAKRSTPESLLGYTNWLSGGVPCPVLFVGNRTILNLLSQSNATDLADRYDISFQDGFSENYICHIGSCEVYRLGIVDVDYCIFTSKEIFYSLQLHKVSDDQYVEFMPLVDEENYLKNAIRLVYRMDVQLDNNVRVHKLELVE